MPSTAVGAPKFPTSGEISGHGASDDGTWDVQNFNLKNPYTTSRSQGKKSQVSQASRRLECKFTRSLGIIENLKSKWKCIRLLLDQRRRLWYIYAICVYASYYTLHDYTSKIIDYYTVSDFVFQIWFN